MRFIGTIKKSDHNLSLVEMPPTRRTLRFPGGDYFLPTPWLYFFIKHMPYKKFRGESCSYRYVLLNTYVGCRREQISNEYFEISQVRLGNGISGGVCLGDCPYYSDDDDASLCSSVIETYFSTRFTSSSGLRQKRYPNISIINWKNCKSLEETGYFRAKR